METKVHRSEINDNLKLVYNETLDRVTVLERENSKLQKDIVDYTSKLV